VKGRVGDFFESPYPVEEVENTFSPDSMGEIVS
jgi:hypothetical protein